jgi:hypothetical protein
MTKGVLLPDSYLNLIVFLNIYPDLLRNMSESTINLDTLLQSLSTMGTQYKELRTMCTVLEHQKQLLLLTNRVGQQVSEEFAVGCRDNANAAGSQFVNLSEACQETIRILEPITQQTHELANSENTNASTDIPTLEFLEEANPYMEKIKSLRRDLAKTPKEADDVAGFITNITEPIYGIRDAIKKVLDSGN